MRKRWLAILLVLLGGFVAGLMMPSGEASAYFSDNPNKKENGKTVHKQCFAMQWVGTVNPGDSTKLDDSNGQTGNIYKKAYSTKWFCAYPNNKGKSSKITMGSGVAISGATLVGSKADGADGFTINVTKNGKGIKVYKYQGDKPVESETFLLSTYDGDFKKLTDAVSEWLPDKLTVEASPGMPDDTEKYTENIKLTNEVLNEEETKAEEEKYGTSNNGQKDSICYEASGHLGWIFCPLIDGISKAMATLYNDIVEPFLVIEPTLLSGDGTYEAWSIFRDFANIAFIILFLVVIFSQLTGYGIDNYGIKRMLPKLIAAAILINLSYLICQIAVDLSNILGNSLESLFSSIATSVNEKVTSPTEYFSGLLEIVVAFLAGGAATTALGVSVAPLVATMGFAAIIPMLLGMLSAIMSVLFMFVILFVRKAIVILLVVVAPIAFIAYIMPNTKRAVFDKWLNLFKGVLLVYPLAGALVGGGTLASAIIVAAASSQAASGDADMGTFLLYLGALLLQVVPFFFLPTLFRRSLSAAGNIGERIATRGRQAGQRTRGAIENSERYKGWSQYQQDKTGEARSRRIVDRLGQRKKLSNSQRMALARASSRVRGYENQREKMYDEINARNDRKVNEAELADALVKTDAERAGSALDSLLAQGGTLEAMELMEGADWNKMDDRVRTRLLQKMASSNVDAFQSFAKYKNTGGTAGFKNWYSGNRTAEEVNADNAANDNKGVKDASYAAHLQERGIHAMDGLSNDEMKFMNNSKRSGDFAASMGGAYASTMASVMVNSGDARVKNMAGDIIGGSIGSGTNVSDLGLTAENLANLGDNEADKIMKAYVDKMKTAHPGWTQAQWETQAAYEIQKQLKPQIDGAKADPRVLSRMSGKTRNMLGL